MSLQRLAVMHYRGRDGTSADWLLAFKAPLSAERAGWLEECLQMRHTVSAQQLHVWAGTSCWQVDASAHKLSHFDACLGSN